MRTLALLTLLVMGLGAAFPDLSHAAFEGERPGARPAGMAGAFCALADDSDAMNYNPAGLAQLTAPVLGLNYARLLTGLDDGSLADSRLAYIQPLGPADGSVGASFYQRELAGLYQENTLSLGYGLPLDEGLYSAGLVFKLFNQKYLAPGLQDENPYFSQKTSVTGWGLDLGGLAKLGKNITAGLSLDNLNQPNMAVNSGSVSVVPFQIRAGLAWRENAWDAATDVLWYADALRFSAGGEYWWFDRLIATRLGVAANDQGLAEGTVGVSLRIQRPIWTGQLDYAFINPFGAFAGAGATHQFNLTIYFGVGSRSLEENKGRGMLEAGRKARDQGRWEEALDCWEQARAFLPNDPEIQKEIENLKASQQKDTEVRMRLQQAKLHADNGRYFNAVEEYRKVLVLVPNLAEASAGLDAAQVKIQRLTLSQQVQQAKKEQEGARQAQLAKQREAGLWIQKAVAALDRAERDSKIRFYLDHDLRRLRVLVEEARTSLKENDSEHAQVLAQTVFNETAQFSANVRRKIEAARKESAAEKEKAKAKEEAKEKEDEQESETEKPAPAAPAPAMAKSATPVPVAPVVLAAGSEALKRQQKKARGAYGLAVKLMLDIEKANGPAYFPDAYQSMKQELSKVKALMKSEDYDTAIRYAEKLFTLLQKLKKDSQEKEKASKAMPTTW
jgi:hypothetical protein